MQRQRPPLLIVLLVLLFELLSCALLADASSMAIAHKLDPVMMRMMYGQMVKRKDENLQKTFKGTMGAAAPAITDTGNRERPYGVDGDTFVRLIQSASSFKMNHLFFEVTNSDLVDGFPIRRREEMANTNKSANFTVKDCEGQQKQCRLAQSAAPVTQFAAIADVTNAAPEPQQTFPFDEEFDIVCDVPDV
ncbi:hypothetical protein Plec18167_001762 [Paecilomyces lecythidis]|uniref:Uncharacterized protein n=1 Tax=Paecilomyces lecythidis TaxID=3004212 RepID=A0ABR3YAT1_9EURO